MLRIALFGRFSLNGRNEKLGGFTSTKVSELFSFLLLHRDRRYARELLASRLWGDHCTTAQSKKYLRQALWQLKRTLKQHAEIASANFLLTKPDWIELRSVPELWLDVAVFEAAYAAVQGVAGRSLHVQDVQTLEQAVSLYTSDLLENWYQDWCQCERERLHHIFLIMLDKLASFYEARQQYEEALFYGRRILQDDRARERTHRQIMRLYALAGDRTNALRQYECCVTALNEELDVGPSRRTVTLYEHLREDQPCLLEAEQAPEIVALPPVSEVMDQLEQIQKRLAQLQQQVQRVAQATDEALGLLTTSSHGSEEQSELEVGL